MLLEEYLSFLNETFLDERKKRIMLKIKKYLKDPIGHRAVARANKAEKKTYEKLHKTKSKDLYGSKAASKWVRSFDRVNKAEKRALRRRTGLGAAAIGGGLTAQQIQNKKQQKEFLKKRAESSRRKKK